MQTTERIHFKTSFEKEDLGNLLVSEVDNGLVSGVVHTDFVQICPGLEVDLTTVEGSANFISSEGKINLFNGEDFNKFVTKGQSAKVSFALVKAAKIGCYVMTSGADWQTRDPKNWELYGSADGENYVLLDKQENVVFDNRCESKTFVLEDAPECLYYRLEILENGGAPLTQFANFILYSEKQPTPKAEYVEKQYDTPGMVVEDSFGPPRTDCNHPGAWTGRKCLAVYGKQTRTENTYARANLYRDLSIPVSKDTVLSYVVFPGLHDINKYDYEYTSCRVTIDLHFTDGSYLSELGALDQNGSEMSPEGQVKGKCLITAQWNYIESRIGRVAEGKTIDRIGVYFSMDEAEDASRFVTFFDDLKIEDKAEVVYDHPSDYVNIVRGTNNDQPFSRGLVTPAATVPNGFNFYTPVTNVVRSNCCYNYQHGGGNNPLDSITIMHLPHFWLGSYGTWQFMTNTKVNPEAEVTAEAISSEGRKSAFTHENEIARAHHYGVCFEKGSPAEGSRIDLTPTSHAAQVKFSFTEEAKYHNVIFDCIWSSGELEFMPDGRSFKAKTNHTVNGSVPMFIVGSFDAPIQKAVKTSQKQAILSFAEDVVTMKLASSFIGYEQAEHNLALEIGEDSFEETFAKSKASWDAILGKFELEGASYSEKLKFYSDLYKMYMYPNLHSENEGTNEEPKWTYVSPHDQKKKDGILYVSNGFWDTYRVVWPAYSIFTEKLTTQLLDGMVQHYIDSGIVPRWTCPGGVNCMVGTSSDIIFADAYLKGISFDHKNAWDSMLRNASAFSDDMARGGRPSCNTFPFKGYIPNSVGEGYSSSIEGYINDYGLYRMAEKMGLTAEAKYYRHRCMKYDEMYNPDVKFFMGKSEDGVWSADIDTYDPAAWTGPHDDYTESVGWVNAFPIVFDGKGMTNLYGGKKAVSEKLDALFDDSIDAMRAVVETEYMNHEIAEFKEVKMGQYEHNNQPAHHLIYTYAYSDKPYMIQKYTREVLQHVYVGSEIGQGYPGDEDNGEMSAWYVMNALGFYSYNVGSNEYVISSPKYDKAVVHLDNGRDLTIIANNNSDKNVYIQSCKVNGVPYEKLYFTHEMLMSGMTVEFEMGSEPSSWASSEDAKPTSMTTEESGIGASYIDLTKGMEGPLFDDDSLTVAEIKDGEQVQITLAEPTAIALLTLSCNKKETAPTAFILEGTLDGVNYETVAKEENITFLFDSFIRPFAVDDSKKFSSFRLTLFGGTELSEIEFLA